MAGALWFRVTLRSARAGGSPKRSPSDLLGQLSPSARLLRANGARPDQVRERRSRRRSVAQVPGQEVGQGPAERVVGAPREEDVASQVAFVAEVGVQQDEEPPE